MNCESIYDKILIMSSLKDSIIKLRLEGKSYNEISRVTGASKGTVSYHCSKLPSNGTIISQLRQKADVDKIKYPERHVVEVPNFNDRVVRLLTELVSLGTYRNELADALSITEYQLDAYVKHHGLTYSRPKLSGYDKVKLRRKKVKLMAIMRLGGECQRCGYHKSARALEFHHVNPHEKNFTISQIITRRWETIRDEVDKCILLCANCHREVHDDD